MTNYKILKTYKAHSCYLVEDPKGDRYVLKMTNPVTVVNFSQLLESTDSELIKYVPRHFTGPEPDTYLREYFDGEIAGNSTYQFGFSDEAFKSLAPKIVAKIVTHIQKISPYSFNPSRLEIRDANWYIERLQEAREVLDEKLNPQMYDNIREKMTSARDIVNGQTVYLSNGDLHPKNFLIVKNTKSTKSEFVIIDWDLLHINNPAYDLALLYLWGWRNKDWSSGVLDYYLKSGVTLDKEIFKICFSFVNVYLSAQLIKHASIISKKFIDSTEVERKSLVERFLDAMVRELDSNLKILGSVSCKT